ncbi:DUF2382 domain-containing protein [Nakamurella sp. YIM 132087]|uniref:DUF2382 domain-containing protein n=1 Tax=Nakamurella alba TaxID=2665158 RepID=A0A7K1FVB4_9ACTN|nr:DUF2382 domain-containing protein [Nakamurella alba]MTD17143.1 DUF2382 domain-containing protein [Nakamurella alba]
MPARTPTETSNGMMTPPLNTSTDPVPGEMPPNSGRALVRSEECLQVRTVRTPFRRVRLEKYRVTETRTMIVEVVRDEIRMVELPLHDSDAPTPGTADATGPTQVQDAAWLVLYEEHVQVTKHFVPVARARLESFLVTENREVTAEVRSERVELEPLPLRRTLPDSRVNLDRFHEERR